MALLTRAGEELRSSLSHAAEAAAEGLVGGVMGLLGLEDDEDDNAAAGGAARAERRLHPSFVVAHAPGDARYGGGTLAPTSRRCMPTRGSNTGPAEWPSGRPLTR